MIKLGMWLMPLIPALKRQESGGGQPGLNRETLSQTWRPVTCCESGLVTSWAGKSRVWRWRTLQMLELSEDSEELGDMVIKWLSTKQFTKTLPGPACQGDQCVTACLLRCLCAGDSAFLPSPVLGLLPWQGAPLAQAWSPGLKGVGAGRMKMSVISRASGEAPAAGV